MFIYVIGSDTGPQKIGVAANPENRLAQLRCGHPYALTIQASFDLGTETAARLAERAAHHRLKPSRLAGEWFDVPTADAIQTVRDIVRAVQDGTLEPPPPLMMTPAQIRAARALLGWKQTDLATAAGVSEISVKNIERGATDARGSTLGKIQAAFEAAGVEIIPKDGASITGGPGVRLKRQVR